MAGSLANKSAWVITEGHAGIEVQAGALAEAALCYRRAIARDPEFAKAHHNLGAVLQKSGDAAGAINCFQTALGLRPGRRT